MSTSDELSVQALRSARVHVVRSEPGKVVLQMTGSADEIYLMMSVDELAALAKRLSEDAATLVAHREPSSSGGKRHGH